MTDPISVTDGQMRLILLAVEHGFRQCEKGENLQWAIATIHSMYRVDDPPTSALRGEK